MAAKNTWVAGLVVDVAVALGLLVHWLVVALVVDLANLDGWHKGVSLYLAVVTLGVNAATLVRSFSILGDAMPQESHSETVVGMFLEICSLAQGWGCAFVAAREWSLPSTDPFFSDPFLHKTANSIFEMSLVQVFAIGILLFTLLLKVHVHWIKIHVALLFPRRPAWAGRPRLPTHSPSDWSLGAQLTSAAFLL